MSSNEQNVKISSTEQTGSDHAPALPHLTGLAPSPVSTSPGARNRSPFRSSGWRLLTMALKSSPQEMEVVASRCSHQRNFIEGLQPLLGEAGRPAASMKFPLGSCLGTF